MKKQSCFLTAVIAVIAVCLTTSAAFADTTIALHSHKVVTVNAVDADGNAVSNAPYTFQLAQPSICTLYVAPAFGLAPNQAYVDAGSTAGTCVLSITPTDGSPAVPNETITVPPGAPVSTVATWQ